MNLKRNVKTIKENEQEGVDYNPLCFVCSNNEFISESFFYFQHVAGERGLLTKMKA